MSKARLALPILAIIAPVGGVLFLTANEIGWNGMGRVMLSAFVAMCCLASVAWGVIKVQGWFE